MRDLRLLLVSRHPLIVAAMDDEARFMGFVRRATDLCGGTAEPSGPGYV